MNLIGKILVDGGYGDTNNPSIEAWNHFIGLRQCQRYQNINIINLGTGSKAKWNETYKPRRHLGQFLPIRSVREISSVLKDLSELATDSDNVGKHMQMVAHVSHHIRYSRFSANTGGISTIRLDEYEKLDSVENATNEYLETKRVSGELQELARQLAEEYKARHLRKQSSGMDLLNQQRERSSVDSPIRPPQS